MEPVELLHVRDHEFVKHGKAKRKGERCAACGWAMASTAASATWEQKLGHLGVPQSLNIAGSGGNHFTYQAAKQAWQEMWTARLEASGLPKGLGAVTVEGQVAFPTRGRRDQGNFRYMLEKSLGDALAEGGWIEDDSWYPVRRFEFGGLDAKHAPGESWTRLLIFPSLAPGV